MGETTITINSEFKDTKTADEFFVKLDKACSENNQDLGYSLGSFSDLQVPNIITVESLETDKNRIFISCYGGRHIEQPIWFIEALCKRGANRTEITSQCDDSHETFYFKGGRRVSRKKYFGITKPNYIDQLTSEELDRIFLPSERTRVDATLVESSPDTGEWSHCFVLRMESPDGKEFYYRGDSDLANLVHYEDRYEKQCSFVAIFELERYKGKIQSFAKRPSKIELIYNESFSKFLPTAKCPYCGKTLRTDKAKQCMHCLKSWHDK